MEHRKDPRFPVHFRSSFSSINLVSGLGILSDLSVRGCRVFSATPVKLGTVMELRIDVSDNEPPLRVQRAVVRWCREGHFGVEFLTLAPDEWARLQHTVKELEKAPYQQVKHDDSAGE